MKAFISHSLLFFFLFSLLAALELYIDPNSMCLSNCLNQSNPFPSFSKAMFILDSIIDQNPTIIAQYPDLANSYNQSSSCEFVLAYESNHYFSFNEMVALAPCDPSTSDCFHKFLLHSNEAYETVRIRSSSNIQLANLVFLVHRFQIYTNFTSNQMSFENIAFKDRSSWGFPDEDRGSNYYNDNSFIVSYYPWTKTRQDKIIFFFNCSIEDFSKDNTHNFWNFFGEDRRLNYDGVDALNVPTYRVTIQNMSLTNSSTQQNIFSILYGFFSIKNSLITHVEYVYVVQLNYQSISNSLINATFINVVLNGINSYGILWAQRPGGVLNFYSITIQNLSTSFLNIQSNWEVNLIDVNISNSILNAFIECFQYNVISLDNVNFNNCAIRWDPFFLYSNNSLFVNNMIMNNLTVQNQNNLEFLGNFGIMFIFWNYNTILFQNCLFKSINGIVNIANTTVSSQPMFQFQTNNNFTLSFTQFNNIKNFNSIFSIYEYYSSSNCLTIGDSTFSYLQFFIPAPHGVFINSKTSTNNKFDLFNTTLNHLYQMDTVQFYSLFNLSNNNTLSLRNVSIQYDTSSLLFETYMIFLNGLNNQLVFDTVQVNDGNQLDLFLKQNVISTSSVLNWTEIQINNLLGYYVTSDYYLDYCSKGCSSCDNSSYCNTCFPTWILENWSCFNQSLICPIRTYFDIFYGFCRNCSINCEICSDQSTCYQCSYNFVPINATCAQYPNCSFQNDSKCLECYSGFYLEPPSSCIPCSNKNTGCGRCSSDGQICYNCYLGYYLQNGCLPCPSILDNCNTCFNESQCEICNSGYTERNGACVSCQALFENCESCTHDYCYICLSGYYLKNNICVSNHFAISFPNGIIGQFYHFFSQKCLNIESNGYNNSFRFMPCNGPATNNSLFKITHFIDDQYIISPLAHVFGDFLTTNCSFSDNDQKTYFMMTSINISSFQIQTDNSSFSCLPLRNLSCQNYQDIYYFNNGSCFSEYINESSIWKPKMINDPFAFWDSNYSFLLQSSNLNNQCLSYSDVGILKLCDPQSFDFMFGFKIIDISQVEKEFVSNLTGHSDTISLKWIGSSTSNNASNYDFLIYYFTDFEELQGYTCGSDKPNSPVIFNQYTNQDGFAEIEVNLTLNDLIACDCKTYEDDNYIYFVMKATNFDSYDNIAFVDSYTIMFQKVVGSEKAIYVGYSTDSNNTEGEIIENNKSVTYLNVSENLNENFNNLYSNKYLNKNESQMINVTYTSKSRFTLNLLNNTLFFVTILNNAYAVNATYLNNKPNEMDIYFEMSHLPSGFYYLKFNIDFEMKQRILAENIVEPSKFRSTFVSASSYYIGTTEDIQKEEAINQPLKKNPPSEIDVKMLIIEILTGLFGLLIILTTTIYLMKRYRNSQKKGKLGFPLEKISELNTHVEDRSPDRLIFQKTQV